MKTDKTSPTNALAVTVLTSLLTLPLACQAPSTESVTPADSLAAMNEIGEKYTRLVLAVGEHDANYVDAYYGPEQWREEAKSEAKSLDGLAQEAKNLLASLGASPPPDDADELTQLRHSYLTRQLQSLEARVSFLAGETMSFDEESKALYDAVAPTHSPESFLEIQRQLENVLPGNGSLAERLETFRADFVIPPDRLDAVFSAAIEACRKRTLEYVELPEDENFEVEYVQDQPWSAYNWYQGGFRSLIQVNTDLPIFIDRAIDLACHEGYPGHHVYNLLLEKNLVRDRGWTEFSVYALFSPQSLIAEGTANFGIQVAFPGDQRIAFEQEVLFPLAGLDPARAQEYYDVQGLLQGLRYAGNEAARSYLDGEIDETLAAQWLTDYSLSSPERAAQRVRFFDRYRSYVINYNLGEDLVQQYIEGKGGGSDQPQRRWQIFSELLSSPRLPSSLIAEQTEDPTEGHE